MVSIAKNDTKISRNVAYEKLHCKTGQSNSETETESQDQKAWESENSNPHVVWSCEIFVYIEI
jgi:hypothetical protein